MTKIIIDSTTDLPDELIEKYKIDMLPLRIHLNSKEYLDKVDIKVEEVYEQMEKGILPSTSSPFPKYTYDLFKGYAQKGQDFIYYSFSSKLSGTYQVAYLAIEDLKTHYPNVNMKIIDTKGGALGSGLIAHQGAKLIEAGESFEELVRISLQNVENIEHLFTVDDLNWLCKGGRISKTQAVLGGALNIKPILEIRDGQIGVIKKVRGRKKPLNCLMELMEKRLENFSDQIIGISNARDLSASNALYERIEKDINPKNILTSNIGSVLATHLGLGGVGVFFFNKKTEKYINEL